MILPVISCLPFLSRSLDEKFETLQHGPRYNETIANGYFTKSQALEDGAVILAYGSFIDKSLRFLLVAFTLWLIATLYSEWSGDNIVKKQVRCKYCRKYISEKALRCFNCTSWMDGREDR